MNERIQFKGGAGRCPFCHDEVPREQRVACVACLAAHHAGCWDEHGACASCGEKESLRRDGEYPAPEPERRTIEVEPVVEEVAPDATPVRFGPEGLEPASRYSWQEGAGQQGADWVDSSPVLNIFVAFMVVAALCLVGVGLLAFLFKP